MTKLTDYQKGLESVDGILYRYLDEEWRKNNSPKYQQYFKEWVNNLTDIQIYYYNTLWIK